MSNYNIDNMGFILLLMLGKNGALHHEKDQVTDATETKALSIAIYKEMTKAKVAEIPHLIALLSSTELKIDKNPPPGHSGKHLPTFIAEEADLDEYYPDLPANLREYAVKGLDRLNIIVGNNAETLDKLDDEFEEKLQKFADKNKGKS